jgi:hypothetical protein
VTQWLLHASCACRLFKQLEHTLGLCCRRGHSGRWRHRMSATCTATWLSGKHLLLPLQPAPHLFSLAHCFRRVSACRPAPACRCAQCSKHNVPWGFDAFIKLIRMHVSSVAAADLQCAGRAWPWRTLCGAKWSPGAGRCTHSRLQACPASRCACRISCTQELPDKPAACHTFTSQISMVVSLLNHVAHGDRNTSSVLCVMAIDEH